MIDVIPQRRQRLYLAFILVLGLVLRLVKLGGQSFSYDEVYSSSLSAKSLGVVATRFCQTPALYHILLHFWLYLGRSDVIIRLLSVLLGMASLWVVYLLGKELLDAKHGLVGAFLLSISPYHIWYSQDARMYSLLVLLSSASMVFFIKFLRGKRGWPSVWWVLTTVLSIYTHYYAAFVLFAQATFYLIFLRKYRSLARPFGRALGAMAILVLPIFFLLSGGRFAQVLSEGAGANPFHIFSVPYTFFAFSLGFSYGPSVAELHWSTSLATVRPYLTLVLPAALLFSALFVLGLLSLWRERKRWILVLLYLLLPILGTCLISLIWPQVSYNVRYASSALSAYVIVLARGLLAPRNRMIRWGLMILVVIFSFVSINNHYHQQKYAKANYRWAAQFVSQNSQEGDVILATAFRAFKYYYRGPLVVHHLLWSPAFYRQMIAKGVRGFRRSWLVMSREWVADPEGKMKGYMRMTYPAVMETTFSNIYVGLFDLTATRED